MVACWGKKDFTELISLHFLRLTGIDILHFYRKDQEFEGMVDCKSSFVFILEEGFIHGNVFPGAGIGCP